MRSPLRERRLGARLFECLLLGGATQVEWAVQRAIGGRSGARGEAGQPGAWMAPALRRFN